MPVRLGKIVAAGLVILLAGCTGPAPPLDGQAGKALAGLTCPLPCVRTIDGGVLDAFEPSIAVDPRDPRHAVAGDAPWGPDGSYLSGKWGYSYVTHDAGATWAPFRLPGGFGSSPDNPLVGKNILYDNVVVILPDGTVGHVVLAGHVDYREPAPGVFTYAISGLDLVFLRSHDGGETYPPSEIRVIASGAGGFIGGCAPSPVGCAGADPLLRDHDKPGIAVGPRGELLLSWSASISDDPVTRATTSQKTGLMAAFSADAGNTWGPARLVEAGGWGWPSPAILVDGTWVIVYSTFHVATSRDRGATWGVSTLPFKGLNPTLRVQSERGKERLVLSYAEASKPFDCENETPMLRWSDDVGAAWSDPLALAAQSVQGCTRPSMDVAADGTIWTTFFDWNGLNGTHRADYRAVAVRNGTESQALTIRHDLAARAGWSGEYEGLAAFPSGAMATWAARSEPGAPGDLEAALLVPLQT